MHLKPLLSSRQRQLNRETDTYTLDLKSVIIIIYFKNPESTGVKYLAESDTDKVRRWKGGCSGTEETQKGFDGDRNMGHGKGKKSL